jgi:PhnB protein
MIDTANAALSSTLRVPSGHNTVNGFVVVAGARAFIAFLCDVFDGAENVQVRTPDRDGSLIHAEVRIGTSTIMLADSKAGWPELPALTQVYVPDAQAVLDKVVARGGRVVTAVTPFYNQVKIARFLDPWNNLWWLYEPMAHTPAEAKADTQWHSDGPSYVYTSLMGAMRDLALSIDRGTRGAETMTGK